MDDRRVLITSAGHSRYYEEQIAELKRREKMIVESSLMPFYYLFNEVIKQEQRKVESIAKSSFDNRPKTQSREMERRRKQMAKRNAKGN